MESKHINKGFMETIGTLTVYAFVYGTGRKTVGKTVCLINQISKEYCRIVDEHQEKCRKKPWYYDIKFETK